MSFVISWGRKNRAKHSNQILISAPCQLYNPQIRDKTTDLFHSRFPWNSVSFCSSWYIWQPWYPLYSRYSVHSFIWGSSWLCDIIRRVTLPTSVDHLGFMFVLTTKFGVVSLKWLFLLDYIFLSASRRFHFFFLHALIFPKKVGSVAALERNLKHDGKIPFFLS